MGFSNPFSHKEEDNSHVVVPLGSAHHRPSIDSSQDKIDPEIKSKDDGSVSSGSAGGLSIESLRAEVMNDVAVEGHDTAYDRT